MAFLWKRNTKPTKESMRVLPQPRISGYKFMLKGSPRHYDDVAAIIDEDSGARVYFGEALMYERGAGVAEWRIYAHTFNWLPKLYDWWVEAERIEPINFTFHLYLPDDHKYPVLDLREHTPDEVAEFIAANAPWVENASSRSKPTRMSSGQPDSYTNYGTRDPRNKGKDYRPER